MRPELFRLFDISFPSYFVLLITGFIFATLVGALYVRRIGENPDVIVDLSLACLIAGVVGARILHVFADGYFWDYVHLCTDPSLVDWRVEEALCVSRYQGVWDVAKGVCHPREADCFAWARFSGGLTFYGGFIVAAIVAIALLKRDKFPVWKAVDMAGIAIPLGLGFGRMGCLLAGCCFGVRTENSMGLSFPPRSPASESQFKLGELLTPNAWSHPVHPTQIYESLMSFAIAAFCLMIAMPKKRFHGEVFSIFLFAYALGRFLLEFMRADDRGGILSLSTSQWIGFVGMVIAAGIYMYRKRECIAPCT